MSEVFELEQTGTVTPYAGGQADFAHDWRNQFVALEGGWWSGKTFIGARKLLMLHLFNAFDEPGDATYAASAIIAPTYGNAMDFDIPELEAAAAECGLKCIYKGSGSVAHGKWACPAFVFPELGTKRHPSVILVRTADAPERIAGWSVGAAWGDEAARWKQDWGDPKSDAFLQLCGRIRGGRRTQLMFTYTNEGDTTRIYEEFNGGKANHALYRVSTRDNPKATEPGGFYDMQRENLTAEIAEQYLEGHAVNLRGQRAYSVFDQARHVDDGLDLLRDRPLQLSLDFNIAPGMHAEIGQQIEACDLFTAVHEIYEPRLDVRGVVVRFVKLVRDLGGWQWPELQIFGDATGGSKWAGTGESCYGILEQGLRDAGIPYRMRVPKSNPLIVDRINAVNVALLDLKGGVHYKAHSRCQRLIQDWREVRRNDKGEVNEAAAIGHAAAADGYRIEYLRPARVRVAMVGGRFNV